MNGTYFPSWYIYIYIYIYMFSRCNGYRCLEMIWIQLFSFQLWGIKYNFLSYWYVSDIGMMVQSQIKSYQRLKKRYLVIPCFTLSIMRYESKIKWNNPGKGETPSPTLWCCSYRIFESPSTTGANFFYFWNNVCFGLIYFLCLTAGHLSWVI